MIKIILHGTSNHCSHRMSSLIFGKFYTEVRMKSGSLLFLVAIVALPTSCAPTRIVKPLEKNQNVVGFTAGGPLIQYANATIPMPLTSIFYARGLTTNTTGFAGLHLTSLLFGVVQTDIGACSRIYSNDGLKIGLTASPVLNIAVDRWERNVKCWPELDMNGYWQLKRDKVLLYAGAGSWFELANQRAEDTAQPKHWFLNPHLGITYRPRSWSFNLEGKLLAPDVRSQPNVVEYTGINNHGAIGIYVAIYRVLK